MTEEELPTLSEIFGKIGDIRQDEMVSRVKKYTAEIIEILPALKKAIEREADLCIGRGTKTDGFDSHCRQIALLLKAARELNVT